VTSLSKIAHPFRTTGAGILGCAVQCCAVDRRSITLKVSDCRESFKLPLKQYAAVVAAPKSAVQMRGEPRDHRTVSRQGVERGVCPTCGSQATAKLERLLEVSGLQAVTRYARSIA
jgi:hypothetical protein